VRQLSKEKICYITMNKTYLAVKEDLAKDGVDAKNIVFVDAISKTIKQVKDRIDDSCICVSSPAALTEISLAIAEFMRRGYNHIIFDSLNDLMIYEKKAPVTQFVLSMVNKLREADAYGMFYAVTLDENAGMLKQVGMFVDKVVEVHS